MYNIEMTVVPIVTWVSSKRPEWPERIGEDFREWHYLITKKNLGGLRELDLT